MAHELETWSDGTASFVSAREHAWHRLGTVLPAEFDAAQAMQYAKLGGWNVRTMALQTAPVLSDDGVFGALPVPDQFATVRTNPVSGGVDGWVSSGVATPSSRTRNTRTCLTGWWKRRSLFRDGRIASGWPVGVPVDEAPPDHEHRRHRPGRPVPLALNSHDGTSAFRLLVSPVRVVCANTQALALRRAQSSFSIRHTSGTRGNIAQAREALSLTFKYAEVFEREAEQMIAQSLTDAQFAQIIGKLWTTESESKRSATITANRADVLTGLFADAPTNANIRGTRWAGYQAITEYLDHFAPVQGGTDTARAERVASGGTVTTVKARAFEMLAAL